jgi:hypothetical protein
MRLSRSFVITTSLFATVALAAQDGTLLRRALKVGEEDSYTLTSKTVTTVELPGGMGEQEIQFNQKSSYKVKAVKLTEKGADVETTSQVEEFDAEGMPGMADMEQLKRPVTLKGTLDAQNRLRVVTEAAANPMSMMMGSQTSGAGTAFVELPDGPVKVGDTWQVEMPKSPLMEAQKVTSRLAGEKVHNGRPVWIVIIEGKLDLKMGPMELPGDGGNPMAGQRISIQGEMLLNSEGLVDKETGKTVRMESKSAMKMSTSLVDMGLDINSSSSTTNVLEIKK